MSAASPSPQSSPSPAARVRTALGGGVVITTLPCHSGPNADAGPKRMMLAQGEFTLLHPACPEIRFCAVLGFPAGVTRGGHYHLKKDEWLYVLRGRLRLKARDRRTGETFSAEVSQGDLVRILPETEHSMTTIEPGEAVEYSAQPHDPADTIRISTGAV